VVVVAGAVVVVVGTVLVVAGAVVVVEVGGGAVVAFVVSGAAGGSPPTLGCGAGVTGAEGAGGTAAFGDPELPQAEMTNVATAPMATTAAR
jgi:hypothetical protein